MKKSACLALISIMLTVSIIYGNKPSTLKSQIQTEAQAHQHQHFSEQVLPNPFLNSKSESLQKKSIVPIMRGDILVKLLFIKPTGAEATYHWEPSIQQQVADNAAASLNDMWGVVSKQYGESVHFVVDGSQEVETNDDPVLHTIDDNAWVSQAMQKLGYTVGDGFQRVQSYRDDLLKDGQYDHAIVIFFLPRDHDGPNKIGLGGYSYLGGPYALVLQNTYLENMAFILRHEMGHQFWALDEYCNSYSCCTCAAPDVRPAASNGNCASCTQNQVECAMRSDMITNKICSFTARQVGWGEASVSPVIVTVKLKKSGKLLIKGMNFDDNTFVLIDDRAINSDSVVRSASKLIVSSSVITELASGSHVVQVRNPNHIFSQGFSFSK